MKITGSFDSENSASLRITYGRQPREPRPGCRAVPVPYHENIPLEEEDERILRIGFAKDEYGRKIKSVFIEVENDTAKEILRMDDNMRGYVRRQERCTIRSGKTGKQIMCPFKNACSKCDRKPEEMEDKRRAYSLDLMQENGREPVCRGYGSPENMTHRAEMAELLDYARKEDKRLLGIMQGLLEGKRPAEIMEELGLSSAVYYKLFRTLKSLVKDFMDL